MRPGSILLFERLYLASIALGLASVALTWEESVAPIKADLQMEGMGALLALVILATATAINLLLWYFAARRASNVARWILVVFAALNVMTLVAHAAMQAFPLDLAGMLGALVLALYVAAVAMLFRPDAAEWFRRKGRGVDPEIFR